MSTPRREWPYAAKDIRDRSAEEAAAALRELEPLIEDGKPFTLSEILMRVARAIKHLLILLRLLESVGAQTKP